jgi:hypothetical protein
MAQLKVCFPVFFLLCLVQISLSQGSTADLELVDELGSFNCEDLLSRLDSFAVNLKENKTQGYVVFYKSSDTVNNMFVSNFLNRHKKMRQLGEFTYTVIPTEKAGKSGVELWMSRGGKEPVASKIPPSYVLDLRNETEPVFFEGELFESAKIDDKPTFVGLSCEACCIGWLNLGLLSNFLDANPESRAYFIIRGTRSKAKQLKEFLLREADQSGLSHSRMRFIYAGKRMINSKKNFVEVETFISLRETKSANSFPYKLGSPR